jgi:hypothetical protein
MRWWWGLLCTRPTRLIFINYSASSLKQQSANRHVAPLGHIIDFGFEPRSDQTKDYKIGICCFSPKHAILRNKSKDWLARNLDIVFKWGDMSIRRQMSFSSSQIIRSEHPINTTFSLGDCGVQVWNLYSLWLRIQKSDSVKICLNRTLNKLVSCINRT